MAYRKSVVIRTFFAIILVNILLALLAGCGATEKATETSTALIGSGMTAEEIFDNFEELLKPISDQFRMTRLPETSLEEGKFYRAAVVTDLQLDRKYHLRVSYTQEEGAYTVVLNADTATYTELNFALLSIYLQNSLNLPETDADAFYDQFKLLSKTPEGSMSVAGWKLMAVSTDETLSFLALYKGE